MEVQRAAGGSGQGSPAKQRVPCLKASMPVVYKSLCENCKVCIQLCSRHVRLPFACLHGVLCMCQEAGCHIIKS